MPGFLLAATLCLAASSAPERPDRPPQGPPRGIPHFQVVRAGVYRGGQPNEEDWAYLKSLGVRTVVKLDLPSEGSDAPALRLGMRIIDASGPPSDLRTALEAPAPARIRLAVASLEDERLWPVYVHCRNGEDRTGLIVGMFRVLHDRYGKKKAYREMRAPHFHPALHGLHEVWESFDGKTLPGGPGPR